jgi:hypothetical protein
MENDLLEYLTSEFIDLLTDEKVKSKIIEQGADALPLPNFIERRVLSIVYGALVEAVKSAAAKAQN